MNVNTASREVLAAVINGSAEHLVQVRQRAPFPSVQEFNKLVPSGGPPTIKLDVRSDYFEVRARLRLEDRVLVERSLMHRQGAQFGVVVRERIASLDQAGAQ